MVTTARLVLVCVLLTVALSAMNGETAELTKEKLQVFFLAGQSNMLGHAHIVTLPYMQKSAEEDVKKLTRLVFPNGKVSDETVQRFFVATEPEERVAAIKEFGFAAAERVFIAKTGPERRGKLTVGYGGSPEKIGPEYGFGLSLEQKLKAPILLIKTAWGGKSLHYDFRPPSAGPYELTAGEKLRNEAEAKKAADENKEFTPYTGDKAGFFYDEMIKYAHDVLNDLKTYHPDYDEKVGYEVAGFVWFQGFNDQFDPEFISNYASNMVALIGDIRKEFKTPEMPVVIGVLGTGMTAEKIAKNKISLAQRKTAAMPELENTVAAVECFPIYPLEIVPLFKVWQKRFDEWKLVGSDRPYHYLGCGKFFVRLGDAFSDAMVDLMKKQHVGEK